jgi:uncharacterized protein YtpQ (UPF0354 family)
MSLLKKLFGGKNQPMSWRDFTLHYTKQCQQQLDIQPEIEWGDDLENTTVHLVLPNGTQAASYLGNFYRQYQQQPDNLDNIIQQAMASLRDMGRDNDNSSQDVLASQILPVLKNTEWLSTTRAQFTGTDATLENVLIAESWVGDLVISYVVDNDASMAFLSPDERDAIGISNNEALFELACDNLKNYAESRVEAYRLSDTAGLYQITLDNTYDASLIFFASTLVSQVFSLPLQGDLIVAVPARNAFLVCAADDAAAIAAMQQQMAAINTEGAYLVSDLLYRLKEGQLSLWQTH